MERSPVAPTTDHRQVLERLEAAARSLLARLRLLHESNEALREEVRERDRRIEALESEMRELNQRKRDVAKRIDNLIAQIDRMDANRETAKESVSHS